MNISSFQTERTPILWLWSLGWLHRQHGRWCEHDPCNLAPDRCFPLKQMKQGQSAPYWPARLAILCRVLDNLRQDAPSNEEVSEELEEVRDLMEESLQLLEEVHDTQNLQQLCGALRGRGKRVRPVLQVLCFCISFNSDA